MILLNIYCLRVIEKLSIPSSKKSRGGCRIFLYILYRAREICIKKRERDGRNARGMRTMRGIQPPVSGVKLKNNKRKEKGIESSQHLAPCHESFGPLCPQNYPAHATHFSKLLSPHLLSQRATLSQWENMMLLARIDQRKFVARAGAGFPDSAKAENCKLKKLHVAGFPLWLMYVCSLFADFIDWKKCRVCARFRGKLYSIVPLFNVSWLVAILCCEWKASLWQKISHEPRALGFAQNVLIQKPANWLPNTILYRKRRADS